ncbi:hypothetical protein CTAM01_08620, partial [Colletotrichum tamarilloi]
RRPERIGQPNFTFTPAGHLSAPPIPDGYACYGRMLCASVSNDGLGSQQPRYFEYMRDVSGQPEVQSSGSARRRHRERSAINHVIPSQDVG